MLALRIALRLLWRRADAGQGLAEYALLLSLVAVLAIGAMAFLGEQVSGIIEEIGDVLDGRGLRDGDPDADNGGGNDGD